MKKIKIILPLLTCLFSCLTGCQNSKNQNDIVILYTNDVHCGYNENMGYSGLSHFKKEKEKQYEYVTLVDSGDFSQGSALGALTSGRELYKLMNEVGYDICVLGNHEFDYCLDVLKENLEQANFDVLCCNAHYNGKKETSFLDNTKPYKIQTYGNTKIGFVGVSTPLSISSSTPTRFMEDGEIVYTFDGETGGDALAQSVQKTVDDLKTQENVDYVILLTHLGLVPENHRQFQYSSGYLATHTRGIDAILDGHSHTEMECLKVKNIDNQDVPISQTGTKFQTFGELTISNGSFNFKLFKNYEGRDAAITSKIDEAENILKEVSKQKITNLDFDLSINDSEGIRMVRSRETNIGDLVADAYKNSLGTQIGLANGGGIRASISKGEVTFKNVIDVNPFGNLLCSVELTGQNLLDMFEYFVMTTEKEYKKDGLSIGESGSFQQVSGLKVTVDTTIPSPVVLKKDTTDVFDHIEGPRRISSMHVLENNEYVPINKDKKYIVASTDYLIKNGGCGMLEFMKDKKIVQEDVVADYQSLVDYFQKTSDLSAYKKIQDRIIVN